MDRFENPPPRHPQEQAQAAADRVWNGGEGREEQQQENQRSAEKVERSPITFQRYIPKAVFQASTYL